MKRRDTVSRGFEIAFMAAELSDAPRTGLKMGSALYSGPRLLALGANLYGRSHPASDNTKEFQRSTHSEHVTLLKRKHYDITSRLTLYVARRRSDGTIGNSRPCVNCLKLCKLAGVTRVWFYEHGVRKEITP